MTLAPASPLTAFLDAEHAPLKAEVRRVLSRPEFAPVYDVDRTRHREITWQRVREIVRNGWGAELFPDEAGHDDVPRFLAIFETLAFSDPNVVIKFGLQFGLFGGAIVYLGTRRHHDEYLARVASLEITGCYAMTEIGHGSDTHRLETVARFDPATDEFVIHTPGPGACKQFIGNAAMHATMAVVFAQLETAGQRPGVFGFLVPIRQPDGALRPGVTLGDTGPKAGLLGIDNGWLSFDRVRVPRANMLDRFGSVSREGAYRSGGGDPTSLVQRAMSGGRVAIALASLSAAKCGLAIAVRYGARRRQFGPKGAREETPLLDYPLHQRRLLPRLATAYALDAALKDLSRQSRRSAVIVDSRFEEATALLKAYATWSAVDTLQECREACGGQGYLARNRIGVLRADVDPMTTLEGDNSLLYLFAGKMRLKALRDELASEGRLALLRHARALWRERAALAWSLRAAPDAAWDSAAVLERLLRFREHAVSLDVARRLRSPAGRAPGADYQTPLLELSQARVERIALDAFGERIGECPAAARPALEALRRLYAVHCLSRHTAWYQSEHVFMGRDARRVERAMARLCHRVRPDAIALVDGFGIPDECLGDLNAGLEGGAVDGRVADGPRES